MHKLMKLKEKLMEELENFSGKEINGSALQTIDTLAHATKNLCKIIETAEESEYSSDGGGSSYRRGMYDGGSSRRGSYDDGGSGRRGSYDGGSSERYQKRNSMGRYSRDGGYYEADEEFSQKLMQLMDEAPDDRTRDEIQKLLKKL